ncbi:solute carrier family 2, facilitated glucose transporter member 4-like isoform X2 [Convolutriloba macropyga]|uniref:solute carrier family 2, facilitated glucose transporter member 4-like isoform X2 n=1 Tax=Convolutriloba macropyga TaxID=536237 RepID=UPI003F51E5FB
MKREPPHVQITSLSVQRPSSPLAVFARLARTPSPSLRSRPAPESTPLLPSNSLNLADESFNATWSDEATKPLFPCWSFMMVMSVLTALIGGSIPVGYNLTVLIHVQDQLREWIVSNHQVSFNQLTSNNWTPDHLMCLINSSAFMLTPFGCALGVYVSDKLGRKGGFYINAVLAFIGGCLMFCGVAFNYWGLLFTGRALSGVFVGSSTVVTNLYLCEISPKYARSTVGTTFQLGVGFGFFTACVLGSSYSPLSELSKWHYLFSVPVITATLHAIILLFCPESPAYLMIGLNNGKAAKSSLKTLRGRAAQCSLGAEFFMLEREAHFDRANEKPILKRFITLRNLRSPLLFCVTVAIASQVCGMTAVIYFPDDLFSGLFNHTMDSEFSEPQQHYASWPFAYSPLGFSNQTRLAKSQLTVLNTSGYHSKPNTSK